MQVKLLKIIKFIMILIKGTTCNIKGINKFEIFLLPKPFIIETDNIQVAVFIRNNTRKGVHARRLSR